ncbi:alpha/beta fold hydrolase [Mycobacterium sp. 236(2023)]|uniref:alpha/beta hydrolase n=1 Tax=Mycobacterium sp. 236(2023) TaxID=3038163 RepID=UPI002414E0B0|nr:alpha/beta fold hydrolase [Mycobacterium sp. 236(2023)]MDG4666905.1 alpha/beta fold hydrolase [Mycobacterium sp. 236(2023)]
MIDKGAGGSEHPVPLLFVHGAWHAAWCWDEHFLNFFAEKGYRALALSFRGHGGSPSDKPLRALSIHDYVDDVASVAATLPTPPVVIGHSMGGFVVQKFLESRDIPAGVLMASAPPRGYLASGLRWIRRHPWDFVKLSATGKSLRYVSSPELARERFFSPHTPQAVVDACASRLQEESARSGRDGLLALPRPQRVRAPMLVLGAREDGLAVTPAEVRATARAYRTEPQFFPGMGHNMMIEPGWQAVAEHIDSWLGERGF